jgi:hypothetical protein
VAHRPPSYRLHKPTGQAVVTVGGRDLYLGLHGSEDSRREYDRIISEWLAAGRGRAAPSAATTGISVSELMVFYLRHAAE